MRNCSSIVNTGKKCILLAPNAFKGTLEAQEFCRILSEELSSPNLSVISLPMCDGGDGTASIVASYIGAAPRTVYSVDALDRPHSVTCYTTADTAVIDLAGTCGLKDLLPSEYDVLNANTSGLGKALLCLVRDGIRHVILGVGGSASIDGGCGALEEMGLKIVKHSHEYRNHILEIEGFDTGELKENFKDVEWTILCDVNNRLCGPEGAARVFGPQKGATPLQVSLLDERLQHYARLLLSNTGVDVLSLTHGGAAGGIAASFHALLGARLLSGADYCLGLSGFRELLPQVQLVITGEGRLDSQSLSGKLPGVIAALCRQQGIPVLAVAGSADNQFPEFDRIYTLLDYAENLPAAIRQPGYYLRLMAKDLKRNIINLI